MSDFPHPDVIYPLCGGDGRSYLVLGPRPEAELRLCAGNAERQPQQSRAALTFDWGCSYVSVRPRSNTRTRPCTHRLLSLKDPADHSRDPGAAQFMGLEIRYTLLSKVNALIRDFFIFIFVFNYLVICDSSVLRRWLNVFTCWSFPLLKCWGSESWQAANQFALKHQHHSHPGSCIFFVEGGCHILVLKKSSLCRTNTGSTTTNMTKTAVNVLVTSSV